MIIVDASVWVRSLVDGGPKGHATRRVLTADPDWLAPAHAALEVLRTIRRFESAGLILADEAGSCVDEVIRAEVRYVGPERQLLQFVWATGTTSAPPTLATLLWPRVTQSR